MLNSRAVFDPLWRATDANGDPIPGAKLKFYLSETTTPMTVYADAALTVSLGTTVTCDSGGYPTSDGTTKQLVYVGVQDFKIVVTDADDVTVVTHDKQQGAVDPNDLPGGTGGSSTTSVEAGAGDYTVVTADAGKLLNRSSNFVIIPVSNQTISHAGKASAALAVTDGTASASDDITLPSAITEGDGFTIGFKHSATGEVVWLASDGANWIAYNGRFPWVRSNAPYLLITDRLNQAPTSPTPGALYIVQGTPTGSWATAGYDEHDVLEADGNGGWIEHNPQVGWQAYVTDENVLTVYKLTGWDDATNAFDAGSDYIEMAVFEHQQTNGTAGGGATSGSRQTYPLTTFSNSASANVITGASLTTNKFKLPVGWYRIDGEAAFRGTDGTQLYLRNDTSSTDLLLGLVYNVQGSAPAARTGVMLNGVFQVTDATHDHVVQYRVETTVATNGLGEATSFSEGVEVYGRFVVAKMQAPAGSQGDAGPQGAAGAGYAGTSTTSKALANSGSQTITTQTGLAYTAGCRVKLSYSADVAKFMEGGVTAYNSGTGSLTFTADYAEGSGTYADWLVNLTGARGANGATGAAGPTAVDYTGDNGTSAADPGSGKIRVNNASMASATAIYINETDRHGTSQAAWIATLDDSTSTVRGQLYVYDLTTTTQKWVFSVTGSITDNGSYDTITVAYVSGPAVAMPTNNVALQFHRTGDAGTGAIGGSSGATDNRLIRADGTGGATVQSSAITVDDNGGITLPADVILSGVLSPSSFSTTQNDYAPTGHETASVFRLTATAASSVTGLTAPSPAASRVVRVVNIGTYTITLEDESASSTAANRFALDCDIQLAADTSCVLIYDTDTARWRAISRPHVGKRSIWIPAGAMRGSTAGTKTTATSVSSAAATDLGANDASHLKWSFSATAANYVNFSMVMPKGWDVGTLTARFFWEGEASGNVEWHIIGAAISDGDSLETSFGTAATAVDTHQATSVMVISPESGALTIGGSPAARDFVLFQVYRDGTAGNTDDTMADVAYLYGCELIYTTSSSTDD